MPKMTEKFVVSAEQTETQISHQEILMLVAEVANKELERSSAKF